MSRSRRLMGGYGTTTPSANQMICRSTAWRNGNTEWAVNTSATKATLSILGGAEKIAVFVNGTLNQTVTGIAGTHDYDITLPAGDKTVMFRDSEASVPAAAMYGQILSAKFNQWSRISTSRSVPPPHRLIVVGDSIPAGYASTCPTTDAWPMLLRANMRTHNGDVTTFTISGEGSDMENVLITYSDDVAAIAECADGTISNTIWYEFGVNSGMSGAVNTPSEIATAKRLRYADIITAGRAKPGFNFWLQSVSLAGTGFETQSPYTFQNYRDEDQSQMAAAYPGDAQVHFFHGETLNGQLADTAHKTTAGHLTDYGIIIANSTFAGNIGLS